MLATEEHQTIPICPVCRSFEFLPIEKDVFDLANILGRWEREAGVTFSQAVWQEYTLPATQHVTLFGCSGCGFAMFQPVITGSQAFYADVTAEEEQYYVREKWEFFRAIRDIRRFGGPRVLDIGCGSGHFLDLLRAKVPAADCTGYEFSPEAAEMARAKGHTVCHGQFPEAVLLMSANKPFDVVCMFQVLEHLSDPMGFLNDVRSLLSADGILIVSVPNSIGPIRHFSSALTEIPPHHVSRWCESAFRNGMPRLGFRILRVAHEPLPHYLWNSYLPVMVRGDILPETIGKILNRMRLTRLLIWLLRRLGVRWLPGIAGHSLYIALNVMSESSLEA